MFNKKLILIAMLAGSAFASVAQAADGTINFTGTISDAACDVSNPTQTVALGNVSSKGFDKKGSVAGATKFSINLEKCPVALTSAVVKFDGATHASDSNLLAITSGTGVATGVGVAIYEEDGTTLIPVSTASASQTLNTTGKFSFIAKYMSTNATVAAGAANAVSDFTLTYN